MYPRRRRSRFPTVRDGSSLPPVDCGNGDVRRHFDIRKPFPRLVCLGRIGVGGRHRSHRDRTEENVPWTSKGGFLRPLSEDFVGNVQQPTKNITRLTCKINLFQLIKVGCHTFLFVGQFTSTETGGDTVTTSGDVDVRTRVPSSVPSLVGTKSWFPPSSFHSVVSPTSNTSSRGTSRVRTTRPYCSKIYTISFLCLVRDNPRHPSSRETEEPLSGLGRTV